MTGRIDGWAPIGRYAVIGDGRTVALIAEDGRIDWWPLPALDSPPVFAALLDPEHGGHLQLQPDDEYTVSRQYVGESNVLETTFTTSTGTVRITDALTLHNAGRLPWTELVRRIDGLTGTVPMRWAIRPGTRFDTAQPWAEHRQDTVLLHCGDQHLALRAYDIGTPQTEARAVTGRFTTTAGSRALLAVAASDDAPVYLPDRSQLENRLDTTVEQWHAWAEGITYDGPWRAAVHRSALTMKLLQYEPTGAIAAAATTSLPERIGGDKNWDYRYMWIRDASYTIDALLRLGLHAEVQAAFTFILRCARSTAPDLKVFYSLDGTVPDTQQNLDAPGYRNSRPVRSGNRAASQTQLGTFGDLFDAVWRYTEAGHALDPPTGRLIADLADRCCDLWHTPDAGLWELHTNRHYTVSKMGCWVALDRALRLCEAGQLAVTHAGRWRSERDTIHAWVNEHCWSATKQAYTFYAGTDDLDAAVLLAGQNGFDRGERLTGTIAAIRRELTDGPLVYRYTGMQDTEGAFLACSFWLASALAALGRTEEAATQMDATLGLAGDLGLFAEQIASDHSMLGNTPQALSHLALVNAAFAIHRSGS